MYNLHTVLSWRQQKTVKSLWQREPTSLKETHDSVSCRKNLGDILNSPSLHMGSTTAYCIAAFFFNPFCLAMSYQISSA